MTSVTKRTIVDLSGLGLDKIEETKEEFRIGAMCTLRQLAGGRRKNLRRLRLRKGSEYRPIGSRLRRRGFGNSKEKLSKGH